MVVSIYINGGLCNQLFEIFTTIAFAIENNLQFIFPYTNNVGDRPDRPRYWHSFLKPLLQYTTKSPFSFIDDNYLFSLPRYEEPRFHYIKIPASDNIILYGYFQSYKYFDKYKNNIFDILQIKEQINDIKNEYISYFPENKCTISMHFRLGDYKQKQEYHPIMPYIYYEKSIHHIIYCLKKNIDENNKTELPHVFVNYFCEAEDNIFVLGIINKLKEKFDYLTFVKIDDNIPDWKQLLIMASCTHNIIANSSFSYFGAYFNQNINKIVCYPKRWFGQRYGQYNVSDICPLDWTKITE
jgi:hypothetical protein